MWISDVTLLERVGWYLLHSFWIGLLCLPIAWFLRLLVRRCNDQVRSVCAIATLSLAVFGPAGLAMLVSGGDAPDEMGPGSQFAGTGPATFESTVQVGDISEPAVAEPTPVPFEPRATQLAETVPETAWVAWLPGVWAAGTTFTALLLAFGVVGAVRLRRDAESLPAGLRLVVDEILRGVEGADRIGVMICDRIASPVLVGILRPVVLLPAAAAGWSPDVLRFVLLHELAHARRWDNLINLGQRLVEAVCFYQPVVWFASAWVRAEREVCCDSFVVRVTSEPRSYAQTLVRLAEESGDRAEAPGVLVCSATRHALVGRVARLLGREETMRIRARTLMVALVVAATSVFTGYCAIAKPGPQTESTTQEADPDSTAAATQETETADETTAENTVQDAEPDAPTENESTVGERTRQQENRGVVVTTRHAILEVHDRMNLHARVAGPLSRMQVEQGDVVKKGDEIARIDMRQQEFLLDELRTRLEDDLEVRVARKHLEVANAKFRRATDSESYSAGELRELKLDVEKFELEVERAQADRRQLGNQIRRQNELLSAGRLVAPLEGTVSMVRLKAGEFANQGDVVAQITSLKRLNATCHLAAEAASRVKKGMYAEFVPAQESLPRLRGEVQYVSGETDRISQTVQVRVKLSNADQKIRAGQAGSVVIYATKPAATTPSVIQLPSRMPVQVRAGKTVLLRSVLRITSVGGHDPKTVRVTAISPTTLMISADKVGTTRLRVVHENDDVQDVSIQVIRPKQTP